MAGPWINWWTLVVPPGDDLDGRNKADGWWATLYRHPETGEVHSALVEQVLPHVQAGVDRERRVVVLPSESLAEQVAEALGISLRLPERSKSESPAPSDPEQEPLWTLVVYPFAAALTEGSQVAYSLPGDKGTSLAQIRPVDNLALAGVDQERRVVVLRWEDYAVDVARVLGIRFNDQVVYGPPGSEGERVGRARGETLRKQRKSQASDMPF